MDRLSTCDRILFLTSVILGILAGVIHLYYLVPVSLLIQYIALSRTGKFRHHELSFLFPLSVISCLPVNYLAGRAVAEALSNIVGCSFLFWFLVAILTLISIEEIVLGLIGLAVWGKQEAFFRDTGETESLSFLGLFIREIEEGEALVRYEDDLPDDQYHTL